MTMHETLFTADHFWLYSLFVCLLGVGVVFAAVCQVIRLVMPNNKPNPFASDNRKPRPAGRPASWAVRSKVLKVPYSTRLGLEERQWDAIVVGSGIGGLTTAWCLAKVGQKVLVLEQHDMAGGCCHTYMEKDVEFDVGIHYIGHMGDGETDRYLLDQITEGQLSWAPIDENYDTVVVGGTSYRWCSSREKNLTMLKTSFPGIPKEKFEKYFRDLDSAANDFEKFFIVKFIPLWALRVMRAVGILRLFAGNYTVWKKSSEEYLSKLLPGTNEESTRAKLVLSYIWGDIGTSPKEAPHPLISGVGHYFEGGGYYPVGGAGQIAYTIVPQIVRAGGQVVCRAPVDEIIVERGAAVGVRVRTSSGTSTIRGNIVVSSAGVINTYLKMLRRASLPRGIEGKVRPGRAAFCIFVGLNGTNKELSLPARNYWIFAKDTDYKDPFKIIESWKPEMFDDSAVCETIEYPMLFLSFPSAKDPTWDVEGVSTCEIVSFAPWGWFSEWAGDSSGKRSDVYKKRKMNIAATMWRTACSVHPQLKGATNYFEPSTGLTNLHYLNGYQGCIYGLDHNLSRFDIDTFARLRAETDIKNLYLSGQDVSTAGFIGGLAGGMVAASAVLGANMFVSMKRGWKKYDVKRVRRAKKVV